VVWFEIQRQACILENIVELFDELDGQLFLSQVIPVFVDDGVEIPVG
jgi:hypothetical protein